MNTVYLREKRSGNYEIVTGKYNQKEYTHKFKTWKSLESFFNSLHYSSKVIKAEYSRSTTYFSSFNELKQSIKKTLK